MPQQRGMAGTPPKPSPSSTLPASGSKQQLDRHPFPSPHPPSSSIKQWGQRGHRPSLPVKAPSTEPYFCRPPPCPPSPNSSETMPASYDNYQCWIGE
ncbi:hypothetical protein ACOMHN_042704 [Nucella lapillus]